MIFSQTLFRTVIGAFSITSRSGYFGNGSDVVCLLDACFTTNATKEKACIQSRRLNLPEDYEEGKRAQRGPEGGTGMCPEHAVEALEGHEALEKAQQESLECAQKRIPRRPDKPGDPGSSGAPAEPGDARGGPAGGPGRRRI
jgi:hypothetical protein